MAGLAALCLLLVLPVSSSQSTLRSEQDIHAPPAPPGHMGDLLRKEDTSHLHAKQTHALVVEDNAKVGLFIAATVGTITLMAAVYCIYTKFYTNHPYQHTQLHNDPELTLSPETPPVCFRGSVCSSVGYGSLSDSPSVISVPPSLSPPPSVRPFLPLFLSSQSLRTISAKDLEKSFL